MKICVTTIGCRFNQVETAEMQELLTDSGFEIVPFSKTADVFIVNSCTVTGNSDARSKQAIRKAKALNSLAKIVVTGCYAQMKSEEVSKIKEVDLVLGNDKKLDIVKHLKNFSNSNNQTLVDVSDINKTNTFKSYTFKNYKSHSRAFVKVQTGCNNSCAYCIVTLARGKSVSTDIKNIIKQVTIHVEKGFREVVLTGVHIGSFGLDLNPKTNLYNLLKELIKIKNLKRIRLSSISPKEITSELIDLIRDSKKICRHLHIPMQSGDDEILKRMKRDYDSSYFKNLLTELNSKIPDICIGVDVMVGFPGETKEKFQNTVDLIIDYPVSYMHVFRFSPRAGTLAFDFKQDVKEDTKKVRSKILKDLSMAKFTRFKKNHIDMVLDIIVESKRDKESKLLKGLTDNYISVLVDGENSLMDKPLSVKIARVFGDKVFGEL